MLRSITAWIGGRLVVYLLLVVALLIASVALPWARQEWAEPAQRRERIATLQSVSDRIATDRAAAEGALARSIDDTRGAGLAAITERRAAAAAERSALEGARPTAWQRRGWLLRADAASLIDDRRRELRIALLGREVAVLDAAARVARADGLIGGFTGLRVQAKAADAAADRCRSASDAVARFDRQWLGKRLWDRSERAALTQRSARECKDARARRDAVNFQLRVYRRAISARRAAGDALAQSNRTGALALDALNGPIAERIDAEQRAITGSFRERAAGWALRYDLSGKLWLAMWLLIGIIVTPFAIRALFFYALAPIVERRPPIRLRPPRGADIPLPNPSTTSVGVRIGRFDELVVRQDFIQSVATVGRRRTRWLLDWRHPLSSMASGLWFLTEFRGDDLSTTVSAIRDPFAEVALLTLPQGAACVLQPRAVVAVVHSIGRPIPITSHWRLGSLHAWLTLQLRYLVFHGPGQLVVKGGRGVRVERAEAGRQFGQDQLVGFSADLAYSVARTETFAPYLFGRQTLFEDRVVEGHGVLIVEEAPMAGRRGGIRQGLEGVADALLKVVGV